MAVDQITTPAVLLAYDIDLSRSRPVIVLNTLPIDRRRKA